MAYGLQIMNAAGTVTFDSTITEGSVCVGLYTVPTTGSTLTFPSFAGRVNARLIFTRGVGISYSFDTAPGYPRFNMGGNPAGSYDVLLFIF